MHETTYQGETIYRCCKCYVEAGGSPADWHAECMRAYEEKQLAIAAAKRW